MESVEAEGNSIDEAIENALKALGTERSKVEIEILANATRGLFGIGGKKARVRASLRRRVGDVRVAAPATKKAASPRPAPPVPVPEPTSLQPAAADRPAPRVESPVPSAPSDGSSRPPVSARPPRPERPPRRERETPPPTSPSEISETEDSSAPVSPAAVGHAREFLGGVLERMGFAATVGVSEERHRVALCIQGDGSGALIGRRGQTLDALEYLVNRIVHRDDEQAGRVVVDCEQYREKRRQALEDLARRTAERVRRRGRPVTLNPMSPRDRRVVHVVLQNDPTLTTRSAGKGFMRKLVVLPRGQRRGRSPE